MHSIVDKDYELQLAVDCNYICLQVCMHQQAESDVKRLEPINTSIEFGINDLIVLVILILFFCGFLIFYPCLIFLKKLKALNRVESFP